MTESELAKKLERDLPITNVFAEKLARYLVEEKLIKEEENKCTS